MNTAKYPSLRLSFSWLPGRSWPLDGDQVGSRVKGATMTFEESQQKPLPMIPQPGL